MTPRGQIADVDDDVGLAVGHEAGQIGLGVAAVAGVAEGDEPERPAARFGGGDGERLREGRRAERTPVVDAAVVGLALGQS